MNNLYSFINQWVEQLIKYVCSHRLSDKELISKIREFEEHKSSVLFYYLVERLIAAAFDNGIVIASKALLKYYLESNIKELEDSIYYGEECEGCEVLQEGIILKKGLFLKVIECLGLTKTKDAYIKHLIANDEEFAHLLTEKDKKYKDLDLVKQVLFEEFEEESLAGVKCIKCEKD